MLHLFNYPAKPSQLRPADLWQQPIKVAKLLNLDIEEEPEYITLQSVHFRPRNPAKFSGSSCDATISLVHICLGSPNQWHNF